MIGFIGCGNMGGALATAAAKALPAGEILLANRTRAKADALAAQLGACVSSNEEIARTCHYIFLGVKPQMMQDLMQLFQFPVTDQCANLFQCNQMIASYH